MTIKRNTHTNTTNMDSLSPTKKTRRRIQPFVNKLYHMLNDPEIHSIVSWMDSAGSNVHSKSSHTSNSNSVSDAVFVVKNAQLFSQKVIPQYFDCTLSSFKRQLNYYGFVRVMESEVKEKVVSNPKKRSRAMRYRHERDKFQKDRLDLLHEIQRSTCNDPKIQMDYLREKVTSLEDENLSLRQEIDALKTEMTMFRQFMEREEARRNSNSVGVGDLNCLPIVHFSRNLSKDDHLKSISLSRTTSIEIGDHDWESIGNMLMVSQVPLSKRSSSAILANDENNCILDYTSEK